MSCDVVLDRDSNLSPPQRQADLQYLITHAPTHKHIITQLNKPISKYKYNPETLEAKILYNYLYFLILSTIMAIDCKSVVALRIPESSVELSLQYIVLYIYSGIS